MNILIIYPHWPPSNLVGAQRLRLIANGLVRIGHEVNVVTVDPKYYEEPLHWPLCDFVDAAIDVKYTKALRIGPIRLIGDIGIRGFWFLYRESRHLIHSKRIDFIWISVPSFYTGLMGRLLNYQTKVQYGIDYIDPWVRENDQRKGWRFILTNFLARFLEPWAIGKASIISGVSRRYFYPVLERNHISSDPIECKWKSKRTQNDVYELSFPYGYDPNDYEIITNKPPSDSSAKIWLYAGAFMPHSRKVVLAFFQALSDLIGRSDWNNDIKIRFIGTGNYQGESIAQMAHIYGLESLVEEQRERLPNNEVLSLLSNAECQLLFGSTEPHYTPSKVFQLLLSHRPIVGALHQQSDGFSLLKDCGADRYMVGFDKIDGLRYRFKTSISSFIRDREWATDLSPLDQFSVENAARKIENTLNKVFQTSVGEKALK